MRVAPQAEEFHARQRAIAARETRARRRVLDQERSSQDRIRKREAQAMERASTREASIRRVFVKAEAQLKDSIAAQQGVVEERYGKLDRSTRAGARRLRATWRHLPQPMELHLLCVRALKDKVPAGRYVALVTLYDRLGGQPLRWSKQDLSGGVGVGQPAATQPVHHRGRFYDTELEVDQWVYSLGPSEAETNPSMVYVIELFLLGSRRCVCRDKGVCACRAVVSHPDPGVRVCRNPVDQVVGWTVLPYTDATFQPASGRYRLPMLRGEVDLDIDKCVASHQSRRCACDRSARHQCSPCGFRACVLGVCESNGWRSPGSRVSSLPLHKTWTDGWRMCMSTCANSRESVLSASQQSPPRLETQVPVVDPTLLD